MVTRDLKLRQRYEAQRPPSRYDDYTVPWNDGRTMAELGFKERYRHREFHMPWFRMRRDSLNNRVLYAYWVLEHSHAPVDGVIHPTPLATDQEGLDELLNISKKSVHEMTRRTLYWFLQAGFLVLADNGEYSYYGGRCKLYYVNRYKLQAWLATLREEGKLPKGCKYLKTSWSDKVRERATRKVQRLSKRSKAVEKWKRDVEEQIKSKRKVTAIVPPSQLSNLEARAYVNNLILTSSTCVHNLRHHIATCNALSSYGTDNDSYKPYEHMHHDILRSNLSIKKRPTGARPRPSAATTIITTMDDVVITENCQNSRKKTIIEGSAPDENWVKDMLKVRCNFKVNTSCNSIVDGISCRAYSKVALLSSHDKKNHGCWETSERKRVLDKIFGVGGYERIDRSASIHHLTMCLRNGEYESNGQRDIYGDLFKAVFGMPLVPEERKLFKRLLNRIYFTKSDRLFASQVIHSTEDYHAEDKGFLIDMYNETRAQYEKMIGTPLRNAEIFKYESLLMVMSQTYILQHLGLRSANVFDELVIENKGKYDYDSLKITMDIGSATAFPEVLRIFNEDYGQL